jgi:hypothetical protein
MASFASPVVTDCNRGGTSKVQKGIFKDFFNGTNSFEHKMVWLQYYLLLLPKFYIEPRGVAAEDK